MGVGELEGMVEGGNKNVNELSKKLLDGWVLISDSCPNTSCSVPLVKSKAGEVYCIGCERSYDLTGPSQCRPIQETALPDPHTDNFELSPEKDPKSFIRANYNSSPGTVAPSPYNSRAAPVAPPP